MTEVADQTNWTPPIIKSTPEGADGWERVPYDPADYGPVTDWATDLDHADPTYNEQAHQIWKDLREGGCPVAHTDRYGGMWIPVTHETVHEIAYDTDHFTSRSVVVSTVRPGELAPPAPIGGAPPITSDPPFHSIARRLLLPRSLRSRSNRGRTRSGGCVTPCSTGWERSRPARRSSTPPSSTPSTSRST